MFHLFTGTISIHQDITYLTNDLLGIEAIYEGSQTQGQFFLVPQMDVHTGMIKYFAFDTAVQKSFFSQVLKIQGIGGRSAYSLAMRDTQQLTQAIESFDLSYVQSIPGIGPKIAKRLLVELKTELHKQDQAKLSQDDTLVRDIITSLSSLGYDRKRVKETILTYPHEITSSELPTVMQWVIDRM